MCATEIKLRPRTCAAGDNTAIKHEQQRTCRVLVEFIVGGGGGHARPREASIKLQSTCAATATENKMDMRGGGRRSGREHARQRAAIILQSTCGGRRMYCATNKESGPTNAIYVFFMYFYQVQVRTYLPCHCSR